MEPQKLERTEGTHRLLPLRKRVELLSHPANKVAMHGLKTGRLFIDGVCPISDGLARLGYQGQVGPLDGGLAFWRTRPRTQPPSAIRPEERWD